jgi:hypothetical protein
MSGGRVITVDSIDAGTMVKSLLHLRLGAGPTSEVSITTTGGKGRGGGGKVMVRQRGKAATSIVRAAAFAPRDVQVVVTCRVEGRRIGGRPTESGDTAVVFSGLPVDRLEAVLKMSGGTELPFANDGPDDGAATDGRGEYYEDGDGGVREARCTKLSIACRRGGRSRRDMARECDRLNRDSLTFGGGRRGILLCRRCLDIRGRRSEVIGGRRRGRSCSGGGRGGRG